MQPEITTNKATQDLPIIIVEDSPTQALQLRRILEQQGYAVLVARHGLECLDLLKEHKPALIISDIKMPEMDGYSMCGAIKQDATLKHIPVILLTTLVDPEDLIRGLEAQADYYLTKPYDENILISRITQLLQAPCEALAGDTPESIEIILEGHPHVVTSSRRHMMNLLLSTYENAMHQNRELIKTQHELEKTNQQLRAQTEKLEHSQANYRALLENTADAMIVVDRVGNVRFLNPAARALFGTEDQQFLSDLLKYSEAVGETIEVDINRQERGSVVAELHVVETQWEGVPASLATLRDVTTRKHYEKQIEQLLDKMDNL